MEEDDLVDDEIVEIFLEEADEVLQTISEYLPAWVSNHSDETARAEVRRAFHTLKGSGRMVQAYDIGELAWSVENMLNRVIDGTVDACEGIFSLVQQVCDLMPELLDLYAHKQPQIHDVEPLMIAADLYSKGLHPAPVELAQSLISEEKLTGVSVDGEEILSSEFQIEVMQKLLKLSKSNRQLSMAVKGINQELTNIKAKLRYLEAQAHGGGLDGDLRKEFLSVKQSSDHLEEEIQRVAVGLNQRLTIVEKDSKSQFGKLGRQINSLSTTLNKTVNKVQLAVSEIGRESKIWAFAAAFFAICFALFVDMFLH